MRRRHKFLRPSRNIKNELPKNLKFRCGICKTSYKTYDRLRTHKYSAFHQFLERKTLSKTQADIKGSTVRQVSNWVSNQTDSDSSSSHDQEDTICETNLHASTNTKRYNLRTSQKRSYIADNEDKEDQLELNTLDKNYSDDNYSSLSSSSSEADDDDVNPISSSSISSHDECEEMDDSNRRYYYCILDDCKIKKPVFSSKISLEEHQTLHVKGEYPCKFCDKVENTVIRLSLHETKLHSKVPSTSSNINNNVFYCARCPHETKTQTSYIKHFASVHLEIYNSDVGKVKRETWQCNICQVKLKVNKSIGKKSERHFKTHHDTSQWDNPEKQVKKCEVDGCKAYFLFAEQLRLHREKQHLSSPPNLHSRGKIHDVKDIILEDVEMESLQCSLCLKTFTSLMFLMHHKKRFHKSRPAVAPKVKQENDDDSKPSWKRIVCPELKCTKSFVTRKALKVHKSLHGNFPCHFCDNIKDYAPDLAFHEYEMHVASIKEEPQPAHNIQANKKRFKCPRCLKYLQNRLSYLRHFVNNHQGLSTIHAVCPICKYKSHEESLMRHNLHSHYIVGMEPSQIAKCNMCPAYFRKETQLYRHISTSHHNESDAEERDKIHVGHKCLQCNHVFRSKPGLKHHQKWSHSGKHKEVKKAYHCVLDRCKRVFYHKDLLARHQKLHERGNYLCQFCDKIVNTILKLSMHEAKEHPSQTSADLEDQIFQCSRCSFSNKSATLFQNHFASTHMNFHLRLKPKKNQKEPVELKCAICGLEFDAAPELATHEALHNNKSTKKIKCPRCTGTFRQNSYVNHFIIKHLSGRIKSKLKTCSICQASLARLDNHYKNYHKTDNLDDTSKIYKCEENQCKAYFLKGEQLVRHKWKMHSSSDTNCKECGKKLKNKLTLQNHMKQFHSYLDEKLPLACDVPNCKRRFAIKAELEWHQKYDRHQNNLSSEKFKCDKCGKEFLAKNRLQSHVSIVHPTRLFICPKCGKTAKTKHGLETHLEYHKNPDERKFQCTSCGKKCATKYLLKDHMKTHTKEKPFVCQYCGEKYAHQHNWKNHMLTKHQNEDNLPGTMKVENGNRHSRKGLRKGDCVVSGVKQ